MTETDSLTWEAATSQYRDRQREGILVAALHLLAEQGSGGMSMSSLANAAGISRATLYRYFADLDSVLLGIAEMLGQHDEDLATAVEAESGARQQLRFLVGVLVQAHARHDLSAEAIAGALPPAARGLLDKHEQRTHRLVQSILEQGRQSGELRDDIDPGVDASLVIGMAKSVSVDHLDRVLRIIDTSFHTDH